MIATIKRAAMGVALTAVANAGMVQAACWSEDAVEAAQIRTLETMLMVASLRCRDSGTDLLPSYNAFVRGHRATLTVMNDRLRAHFGNLNAYDRYVTSVANRYGGGAVGLDCEDMAGLLKTARRADGSADDLAEIAQKARIRVTLPGERCAVTLARAR
jgi:hypothetical protein